MIDNKLITVGKLTKYNDELYNRIGKQWDFVVENRPTDNEDNQYQALLELGSNPSHYRLLVCKEVNGVHTMSEVYFTGELQSQGKYTGYAINSEEFYIAWKGGKTYLAVKARAAQPIIINFKIKVLLDAGYGKKWKHSCKTLETPLFMGYEYAPYNIPNIIPKAIEPIDEESPLTEIIETENGEGTAHSGYLDYIVDNTNDSSEVITIRTDTSFNDGVYRFAIKDTINAISIVDGLNTTSYNTTKIYKDGILTYTKETDGEGNIVTALDYAFPDIYSPDESVKVTHTEKGSTELEVSINSITKCLHLKTSADVRELSTGMTFPDRWHIDTDVTHIHIEEPAKMVIMGIWANEGQSFKNGQRLTISGWFRIGESYEGTIGGHSADERSNFSRYYYGHIHAVQYQDRDDLNVQYNQYLKTIDANATYNQFFTWKEDRDNEEAYQALKDSISPTLPSYENYYYQDWDHCAEAFEEFIYWNGRWYDRGYLDPLKKDGSGVDDKYIALNWHTIPVDDDGYYETIPEMQPGVKTTIIDVGTFNNLLTTLNSLKGQVKTLQSQMAEVMKAIYWNETIYAKTLNLTANIPDMIEENTSIALTTSYTPTDAEVDLEYTVEPYTEPVLQSLDDDTESETTK